MGTTNEAYSLMWFTPPPFILVSHSVSVTLSLHPAPLRLFYFFGFHSHFHSSFTAAGDTRELRGELSPEVDINTQKHVTSLLSSSVRQSFKKPLIRALVCPAWIHLRPHQYINAETPGARLGRAPCCSLGVCLCVCVFRLIYSKTCLMAQQMVLVCMCVQASTL